MLKDLQISEDQVTIAPGPHPTLTSWIILPKPSQEMTRQFENTVFGKENCSMVSLTTEQGDLSRCSAIVEVYLSKKSRNQDSVTKFWATLHLHLARSMDKYEHWPQAQYESTNKIRLG